MTPWEQNAQWVENDLYFDFSKAVSAFKLDEDGKDGHGLSCFLKSVDFIVQWENQFWLIEVKDPENGKIPAQHRSHQLKSFKNDLESNTLIEKHLFPKLRDSLIYLGMNNGIPNISMRYICLIAVGSLGVAELSGLKQALWNTEWVKGPARGWSKNFDIQCLNIEQWNKHLKNCPITRISEVT
ncbi:hypothetical protein ACET8S_20735 [Aeromonas veronii]